MRGYHRSNTCPALSRPQHREHVITRKLSEIYSSDAYDTQPQLLRRPSTTSIVSEQSDVKWLLNESGLDSKDDASLLSSNMSCGTDESNIKWLLKDANSECQLNDPIHSSTSNFHSSTSFLAPPSSSAQDSTANIMYIRQRKKQHVPFKKRDILALGEFSSLPPRLYHAMKVVQFILTSYYYVNICPTTRGEQVTASASSRLSQQFATLQDKHPKHMISCCIKLQQFVQKNKWTVKNAFEEFSWVALKPFFQMPVAYLLLNHIAKDIFFASQYPNALRRYLVRLVSVDIFRLKSNLERLRLSDQMVNYVFAVTAHIHDTAMQRGNFGKIRNVSLLKSRLTDMHFKALVSTAAAKYVAVPIFGTPEDHAVFVAAQTLVGAYDKLQLLVPNVNYHPRPSDASSVFLTATEEVFPLSLADIPEYYSSLLSIDGAPPYRDFVNIEPPSGGWNKRNDGLIHMVHARTKTSCEFPSIICIDAPTASPMLRTLTLQNAAVVILSQSYLTRPSPTFNPSISVDLFSSSILTSTLSVPSSPLCYAIGIHDASTEEFDFVRNHLLRPADSLLLLHVPVNVPENEKRSVAFADTILETNTRDITTETDDDPPTAGDTLDCEETSSAVPVQQYYTSRGYNIITVPMHQKASIAEHITAAALEGDADILIIGQSKRKRPPNPHHRLSIKIAELAVSKDLSVMLLPVKK